MGDAELSADSDSGSSAGSAPDDGENELLDPEWAQGEVAAAWRRTASSGRSWRRALQSGVDTAWALWSRDAE
eukprot:5851707-Alexandrium_andersonii.AAC.1